MKFSFYLKNHNFKVVDQDSKIAEKDEIVISKVEYEELVDSKLKMSNELESLTAEWSALQQMIETLEMKYRNREIEEGWQKEKAMKLLENLSTKIFHS